MSLGRNLRLAVRNAGRTPAFSAAVVLTLALGIGASTAMGCLANAVLRAPGPFFEPDRLVAMWGEIPNRAPWLEVALADYERWRQRTSSFSDLAMIGSTVADSILGPPRRGGEPIHVRNRPATGNLFSILGVRAALGRALESRDDRPDAEPVAVISNGLWRRTFGADPAIVGRSVPIDGQMTTIVGVMPAGFDYPEGTEIWTPIAWVYARPELVTLRIFETIGRLAPGVSFEAACIDLDVVSTSIALAHPELAGIRARARPLMTEILGDARPALHLLLIGAALLLAIGCANVAGLWLARAAGRRRETAIRRALGAGGGRLAGEILTESLAASSIAALFGWLLARLGVAAVAWIAPADLPALRTVAIEGRDFAVSLGVALVAGLFAGLPPLAAALRSSLTADLQEGYRAAASRAAIRSRALLVIGEVALTLVLLIVSALVGRSLVALDRTDVGFRPEGLLAVRVQVNGSAYDEPASQGAFFARAVERLRALPGVERASAVLQRPFSGPIGWDYSFAVEGQSEREWRANPVANHERVSPGYFSTLGIPLLAGRDFAWSDDAATPRVAIVSETAARRYFPDGQVLGRRLRLLEGKRPWITVIGVAGDVRYREREAVRADVYMPFLQEPFWAMDLMLRTSGEPSDLIPSVRRAIRELDPGLPIFRVQPMTEAVAESVSRPRLRTLLLALFACLALVLSGLGLASLLFYLVAERRRELAIRLVLGAGRRDLLGQVVGRGLSLALVGLAFGLLGSLALATSGALDGLLFGLGAVDGSTYAVVSGFLLLVALAASILPASRATEVEPVATLREG